MRTQHLFLLIAGILMVPCLLLGQEKDTTSAPADTTKAAQIINDIKESKVSKRILKSITRKRQNDPVAAVKSEAAFIPYEGKIIRNIIIRHIDFQRTVYDTTKNI